jgi:PAP2 superfamily
MTTGNSNLGGQAFAFSGQNAFAFSGANAFAFSGNQAFAFGGAIDRYGFDGSMGNAMLAVGLKASMDAALSGLTPLTDKEWIPGKTAAAAAAPVQPAKLFRWGGAPRSALIQLELAALIGFDPCGEGFGETVTLNLRGAKGPRPLMAMTCPSDEYFKRQLPLVYRDSVLRERRAAEILTQVTTPMSYFATALNMQAERHKKTLELLDHCLRFAYAIGMRFKHQFAVTRPSELSPFLMPMIEVPQHGAFPMGHATESHVIAGVLAHLAGYEPGKTGSQILRRIAGRISQNRVVAGVHFPVDGLSGRLLGEALAKLYISWGTGSRNLTTHQFKITEGADATDARQGDLKPEADDIGEGCTFVGEPFAAPEAVLFQELWSAAAAEWPASRKQAA